MGNYPNVNIFVKMGELFTQFDNNILILRKIAKNYRLFSGFLSSGECRGFYVFITSVHKTFEKLG